MPCNQSRTVTLRSLGLEGTQGARLVQPPCSAGSAQGCTQSSFSISKEEQLHKLPGQPVLVFDLPCSKCIPMEFYIFSICVHDILSSHWGSLRRAGLCPLHQVFTHTDKALPTLFFSRLKIPSVSPHTTDTPIPPCSSLSMSGTRDARTGPSTPNV